VVCGVSRRLKLGLESKLLTAVARSAVQLFFAGYVLLGFVFSMRRPIYVLGYLFFMILIAALEVTSRQLRTYSEHFRDSVISVFASGGLIGIVGTIAVFSPSPWFEPSVFVPAAGMIIGNSISGPALAVDRLLADVSEKRHESETRLAFGATAFEAVLPSVRSALSAALMPCINLMSVVGLVSIPGMMAGQLLGGSPPIEEEEYQMATLWLIVAVAAVSTLVATHLACHHAVFLDSRLTLERIIKRDSKVELEMAIFRNAFHFFSSLISLGKRLTSAAAPSSSSSATYDLVLSTGASAHNMLHPDGGSLDKSNNGAGTLGDADEGIPAPPRHRAKARWEDQTQGKPPLPSASASPALVLQVERLNVMSGDLALFDAEGLSFDLRPGEIAAFSGPSGIGKTRLLRALAQLDCPLAGRMGFAQFGILPDSDIPCWRTRVLYVPQAISPMAGTPKSFLQEVLDFSSRGTGTALNVDAELARVAESIGLEAAQMTAQWLSLSGGQRQRACIALALILACSLPPSKSPVVLFDEPTAACDEESKIKVESAIISSGVAAILITHDLQQAMRLAHKRAVITLDETLQEDTQVVAV